MHSLYEDEHFLQEPDPQEKPVQRTNLYTQPYDLVVTSLLNQISDNTVNLRHISDRPKFQRRYVWSDKLASRLIESILLNVPIPPCYFAQDRDYKLDVIDGQQRIYSIYRFVENQFKLRDLEMLTDLNGKAFFELPASSSRKLLTYTLRCIIITNDSDPDIRFEVFERLNTNTMPLNGQELRNSISRGPLIDLLGTLTEYPHWLTILNQKQPDARMRDEEMILRFFAYYFFGTSRYRTPQKRWLNDMADEGRHFSEEQIGNLGMVWKGTIDKCLLIFQPHECFRRIPIVKRQVVNRALMDLIMTSLAQVPDTTVKEKASAFYKRYSDLLQNEEFADLITRAIDHKSRMEKRFALWRTHVTYDLN